MTLSLSGPGLELPVYNPETTIIADYDTLTEVSVLETDTFVRVVRFRAPGSASLTEALAIADEEFDYIAQSVGAEVVGHSWGLLPITPELPNEYLENRDPLLPDGHILVAKVDVVRCLQLFLASEAIDIERGVEDYNQYDSPSGLCWCDANIDQFVFGTGKNRGEPSMWLVDIEPRLGTNDLHHETVQNTNSALSGICREIWSSR
jgi:hypothetical protein